MHWTFSGASLGRRSALPGGIVLLASLVALPGCGSSSLLGPTASSAPTSTTAASVTTTTVPLNNEIAVAYPVVPCDDPANGITTPTFSTGWKPTILLAPIPTSLVSKVAFYSNGVHTVLGPKGWTCSVVAPGPPLSASQATTTTTYGATTTTTAPGSALLGQNAAMSTRGAVTLAVYPSTAPVPPTQGPPPPGTDGVFATFASTSTQAGIALVCPYATLATWQTQSTQCAKPAGEQTNQVTPDVTTITDPLGVIGGLAGSGGQFAVTGTVIVPQDANALKYGNQVQVAGESCSLSDASICPTVLTDFEVREFPVAAVPGR
jgi:hypothetical protein